LLKLEGFARELRVGVRFARRPTLIQVAVGLFVIWQLGFLLVSNILGCFPHGEPDEGELSDSQRLPAPFTDREAGQEAVDFLGDVMDRWARGTGQIQIWSLFAPGFPKQATFPAVDLRWDAKPSGTPGPAPVRLLSSLDPCDPACYHRLSLAADRFFHYEIRLGLIYTDFNPESLQRSGDQWPRAIAERIRRQRASIRAYLRWRMHSFQQEHPELRAADEVILSFRLYRTPPPESDLLVCFSPAEQPLVRWRPGATVAAGYLDLEVFDPISKRFKPVAE
jgi:hypothetical protein